MVQEYIDQFKNILPTQIQDYWWAVLLMAGLVLLLIIINIPKLFKKKHPQVEAFKANNAPQGGPATPPTGGQPAAQRPAAVPQEHHEVMVQHNVHQPHKDYNQLHQFVKAQLEANFDVNLIRTNLMAVGWDQNLINESISKVSAELQEAAKPEVEDANEADDTSDEKSE